ncbi:MAG: LUD domain-containing protein [Anaerolineales bacterium]|nr:LUD domain-containing protein [Anaerolineales bacterium]
MLKSEIFARNFFTPVPSKTADIEQTMSVGVHGPKKFIVVLVG